jgi:hypothetical protein
MWLEDLDPCRDYESSLQRECPSKSLQWYRIQMFVANGRYWIGRFKKGFCRSTDVTTRVSDPGELI